MTDDERIERLTELSRRVWPDAEIEADRNQAHVGTSAEWGFAVSIKHPRALEALEAALLVLAGEPSPWVEQLASEWEVDADACERATPEWGRSCLSVAKGLRQCARELRGRAKGES